MWSFLLRTLINICLNRGNTKQQYHCNIWDNICSTYLFTAIIDASLVKAMRSAPTKPGVRRASTAKLNSSLNLSCLQSTFKTLKNFKANNGIQRYCQSHLHEKISIICSPKKISIHHCGENSQGVGDRRKNKFQILFQIPSMVL